MRKRAVADSRFIGIALSHLGSIDGRTPAATMRLHSHFALIFLQLHLEAIESASGEAVSQAGSGTSALSVEKGGIDDNGALQAASPEAGLADDATRQYLNRALALLDAANNPGVAVHVSTALDVLDYHARAGYFRASTGLTGWRGDRH